MDIRKRPIECMGLYPCDRIVDAQGSKVISVHRTSLALAELCIDCPRVLGAGESDMVAVIVNENFPLPGGK